MASEAGRRALIERKRTALQLALVRANRARAELAEVTLNSAHAGDPDAEALWRTVYLAAQHIEAAGALVRPQRKQRGAA